MALRFETDLPANPPSWVDNTVRAVEAERGVSPLAHSRATSDLAAMLKTRLGQEVTAAAGTLIPIPGYAGDASELQQQLAALRGKMALAPTTSAGWDTDGKGGAPRHDWRTDGRESPHHARHATDQLGETRARGVLSPD